MTTFRRPHIFLCTIALGALLVAPRGWSAPEAAAPAAAAPAAAPAAGAKLRVVTRLVEPFVMQVNGDLSGYSIDLWRQVAAKAGLNYEFITVQTVPEMIDALRDNKADVAVAALSMNADREKIIGFSYPFYESGLQIAVPSGGASDYLAIVGAFFTPSFLMVIVSVLGLLVLASFLIWFLERKHNPEFPAPRGEGLAEAFWYALNVIISGGCENKSPVSLGGRFVATVWMLSSLILVAAFTATITSTLTVNNLTGSIKGVDDLSGHKVGCLPGTAAASYLQSKGIVIQPYPDLHAALAALQNKELDAVVYDSPMLKYLTKTMNDIRLVPVLFDLQDYGFGLSDSSIGLRKKINVALLSLREEGAFEVLNDKYFGKDKDSQ